LNCTERYGTVVTRYRSVKAMRRTQRARTTLAPSETEVNAKALTVLRAARNVFLTHGFSAATTDMIQREAGVSKATVYAHYPNKEALFVAVIEAECATFVATMQAIEFHPGKLRETLTALARAYLHVVLSPIGLALFRVVIAEAPRFPNLARTLYLAGPQVIATMVAGHLENAAASGEVDLTEVGPDAAANLFIKLVRSEPQLHCLTHPNTAASAAQITQWTNIAVTTFMRAYGSTGGKASRRR
jgi:TetR/AcrR family transcriptional regulator, mexJK operon transcriptional repressor